LRLTEQQISSLAALVAPPEHREKFARRVAGQDIADWRVLIDAAGEVNAAVAIAPISPMEMQLRRLFVREGEPAATGSAVIAEAIEESRTRGAHRITTRVHERNCAAAYVSALEDNGFEPHGGRVEFKTPLDELPDDAPGELVWRATDDVAEAAVLLQRVAVGDPGASADDDPVKFIEGEFAAPHSISRMEIGSLDGVDVAFVLAEVEPGDGWSTLSYCGVIPAVRGRGLGVAAHRHGLAMLRAMGGKLYHGGCSLGNAAMIRVFEANGCREFARMREWSLRLEVDDD
jgi:GNAT superfamily N-acetyltransferase